MLFVVDELELHRILHFLNGFAMFLGIELSIDLRLDVLQLKRGDI